jgi:hypothetical protein
MQSSYWSSLSLDTQTQILRNATRHPGLIRKEWPHLQGDRDFWIAAIQINPEIYSYIEADLKRDTELAIIAIQLYTGSFPLEELHPDSVSCREIVLELVKHTPGTIKWSYPLWIDDDAIMETAVQCDPNALRFASDRLKDSIHLVQLAVQFYGNALKWASPRCKSDTQTVRIAVSQNETAIQHASMQCRNDKNLVIQAMSTDPAAFQWASPQLQSDAKLIAFYNELCKNKQYRDR